MPITPQILLLSDWVLTLALLMFLAGLIWLTRYFNKNYWENLEKFLDVYNRKWFTKNQQHPDHRRPQ